MVAFDSHKWIAPKWDEASAETTADPLALLCLLKKVQSDGNRFRKLYHVLHIRTVPSTEDVSMQLSVGWYDTPVTCHSAKEYNFEYKSNSQNSHLIKNSILQQSGLQFLSSPDQNLRASRIEQWQSNFHNLLEFLKMRYVLHSTCAPLFHKWGFQQ
jgi:hypothetical protein